MRLVAAKADAFLDVTNNWRNDSCILHEVTPWLNADAELLLFAEGSYSVVDFWRRYSVVDFWCS